MPNNISLKSPDALGFIPDLSLVGKRYTRTRTQKDYEITGFAYMGEFDQWGIIHREVGHAITFCRSHENFFGFRDGDVPRFKEIK